LQTQNKEGMWEHPTPDRFLLFKKYPHLPLNVTGHGWFTAPLNLSSISYWAWHIALVGAPHFVKPIEEPGFLCRIVPNKQHDVLPVQSITIVHQTILDPSFDTSSIPQVTMEDQISAVNPV